MVQGSGSSPGNYESNNARQIVARAASVVAGAGPDGSGNGSFYMSRVFSDCPGASAKIQCLEFYLILDNFCIVFLIRILQNVLGKYTSF